MLNAVSTLCQDLSGKPPGDDRHGAPLAPCVRPLTLKSGRRIWTVAEPVGSGPQCIRLADASLQRGFAF